MAPRVNWPLPAEKFVLDWIEDNKGPGGKLLQDGESAIQELAENDDFLQLVPMLQRCTPPERLLKITEKLKRMYDEFRLPQYQEPLTTIYKYGVKIFNWDTLGKRYATLYTPEEIETRIQLTTSGTASPPTETSSTPQPGSKRKSPDAETDDRTSKHFRPCNTGTDDGDGHAVIDKTREIPPQSEPVLRREISSDQQRPARTLPALPALQPFDLRNFSTIRPKSKTANLPKATELLERGYERLSSHGAIDGQLREIYDKITEAVKDLVEGSEIGKDQPICFEPESAYPDKLARLMMAVLGYPGDSVRARHVLYQRLQQHKIIGWHVFIRSLLAAAVTRWCLDAGQTKSDAMGEQSIYQSYGNGVVQKVLENFLDPELELVIREKLLVAYIDQNIIPKIQSRAEDMAFRFQTFVELLLPRLATRAQLSRGTEDIIEFPEPESDHPAAFKQSPVQANFDQALISIFKDALHWRAGKDKITRERYTFVFPSMGASYVSEDMFSQKDKDGNRLTAPIVVCLWPIAYRSTRSARDPRNFEDRLRVSKGVVL
ncbi:hypothetical protein PV08_03201 [Exophiala spinifera]|uniref:Uncharacterized protein n=1 Tax=Exophiala spinifera TaxID=91928 RepID=A0A0D2A1U8_9EURO|nr:uncharacterized protein PV08_03201 [Exophiala spinifera]KIW18912.1 hypothetical protein PV08_03201 [Exophiala spinifera]